TQSSNSQSIPVLDAAAYQEGLEEFGHQLREQSGLSLDEYREILRLQIVEDKVQIRIGATQLDPMEPQVRSAHILIRVDDERTDAEAETLAWELWERIQSGEEFATLAQEYSDDPGSAS